MPEAPVTTEAEQVGGEVLVVIHVDNRQSDFLRRLEEMTSADERLYLLVPADPSAAGEHSESESAVEATAKSRLGSMVSQLRSDGRTADGEVGEVYVLDSVAAVLGRRQINSIVVVTPPLGLAAAIRLDLAHRVGRAFGLPTRHLPIEGATWSGGLDLSLSIDYEPERERLHPTPDVAPAPAAISRRASTVLLVISVVLAVGLAAAVPWGIHETDVANRRGLIRETAAPAVFNVMAGFPSAGGDTTEYPAYYPAQVIVHPGDTINFVNPTADVPHTVTFGVAANRSNQPVYGSNGGGPILSVAAPCAADEPLRLNTLSCPSAAPAYGSSPAAISTASLPAFSGQDFYNSGIIGGGQQFSLHLSASLKPGKYHFFCLIHPNQEGTIVVKPAGQPTQLQSTLDTAAHRQEGQDQRTLSLLEAPPSVPPLQIRAGVVGHDTSLNQFFPADLHVQVGQTVTWTNTSTTPHVIVFDEGASPAVALFSPPTEPSGSDYDGGPFITGPIGAPAYPTTSFSLRFTKPGTYSFFCTFHPGMAGTITVAPP